MSNEDSTTPTNEDTEGHAVRGDKVSQPVIDDDTNGHFGLRRGISDAGTDDDTEGNKLK
jgi:hypothetical protein